MPGGKAILVAVGVLLQVSVFPFGRSFFTTDCAQATKGVSQVYNAVEYLLRRVKDYFERLSIHLAPSILPSPPLMNVLVDTLAHVFTALALTTAYCDVTLKSGSKMKRVARTLLRRTGMLDLYFVATSPYSVSQRITFACW